MRDSSDARGSTVNVVRSRDDRSEPVQPAIALKDISKQYSGLHVLSGLTLDIPLAGLFGIIGPNGAGKTTLINIVSGFDLEYSGSIALNGVDTNGLKSHELTRLGLARTFQHVRLFRGLTVREEIVMGAYSTRKVRVVSEMLGLPRARQEWQRVEDDVRTLLGTVGLESQADDLADSLSYGAKRRLEIARALAAKPRVLLLDEPTAGMNSADSQEIGRLLAGLVSDGMTVVVIEHNVRLIQDFCACVAVLNAGQLLAYGTPTDCLDDSAVRVAYFGR